MRDAVCGMVPEATRVVEDVGIGAVHEHHDHMARHRGGGSGRLEQLEQRPAILNTEEAAAFGRDTEQREHRRRDVDHPAPPLHEALAPHTRSRRDERGPGLDHVDRPVLAAMACRSVSSGVQDTEVGRIRVVEDVRHPLKGVGIAVVPARWLAVRHLVGQGREPGGVLRSKRVVAAYLLDLIGPRGAIAVVASGTSVEPHLAVDGARLVDVGCGGRQDHLHHRLELVAAEHVQARAHSFLRASESSPSRAAAAVTRRMLRAGS